MGKAKACALLSTSLSIAHTIDMWLAAPMTIPLIGPN